MRKESVCVFTAINIVFVSLTCWFVKSVFWIAPDGSIKNKPGELSFEAFVFGASLFFFSSQFFYFTAF